VRYSEFELPSLFAQWANEGRFERERGSWRLTRDVDAFGQPLETEIGEVYVDLDSIQQANESLPTGFKADGYYGEPDEKRAQQPGYIPDILRFESVICFAASGDGAPFCFDYRDQAKEPAVLWWDDWYWRRVAPDFESFVQLFDWSC
jgi:hypothetical protein